MKNSTMEQVDGDQNKSTDAFQLMMDSRKKVIGSNSPGKDLEISDDERSNDASRETKTKRKLFLEKWASKKGGESKKQKESNYDEFIKETLTKRKVKLKKMLQSKKKPKLGTNKLQNNCGGVKKISKSILKEKTTQNNDQRSNEDDDDFINKLSSPLKKKEDMFSYFKKIEPTNGDVSTKPVETKKRKKSNKKTTLIAIVSNLDKTPIVDEISLSLVSEDIPTAKSNIGTKLKLNKKTNKAPLTNGNENGEKLDLTLDNKRRKKSNLNNSPNAKVSINGIDIQNSVVSDGEQQHSEDVLSNKKATPHTNVSDGNEYKTSRPSRKCKNLVRYTSESEDVFEKCRKRTNVSKRQKIVSSDDDESEKVTVSSSSESDRVVRPSKKSKNVITIDDVDRPKKNLKLAPLFAKQIPKPLIDPNVLLARQKFLYSTNEEASDKLKRIESAPEVEVNLFPALVHVLQIGDDVSATWNLPKLPIVDSLDSNNDFDATVDPKLYHSMNNYNAVDAVNDTFSSIKTYDVKDGLLEFKNIYPRFPVYRTFKQLRQKFTMHQKEDGDNPIWTEKYKPLHSDDIVGNDRSVEVLKKWLSSWKECRQEMLKNRYRDDSSDSEFWSDSDSNDSSRLPKNTYVVVGPIGSGKTSSIYAIANELDMNVLEVNASSRRTGKKMITELQEATQSHKVLTEKDLGTVKSHKKSKSKRKRSKAVPNPTKSSSDTNRMSLILIEDADIVFDEDDGFVTALNQIVHSSKRPVIIVTSDAKCPHLKKFMSDSNVVKFHALSGDIVGPWLDIMTFIESGKICPRLFNNSLVNYNKGDMRKTLLQLQSWIVGSRKNTLDVEIVDSVNDEETTVNFNEDSNSTCDSNSKDSFEKYLLQDVVQLSRRDDIVHSTLNFDSNSLAGIDSICCALDTMLTIDDVRSRERIESEDFGLSRWCRLGNSLSESECQKKYAYDLTSYCESMIDLQDCTRESFNLEHQKNRLKIKQRSMYSQLCEAVPITSQLDRSSVSVDYMAYLRDMCRSEKHRSNTNVKRNNRFYHYLATLSVDDRDSLFDDACEIFQTSSPTEM